MYLSVCMVSYPCKSHHDFHPVHACETSGLSNCADYLPLTDLPCSLGVTQLVWDYKNRDGWLKRRTLDLFLLPTPPHPTPHTHMHTNLQLDFQEK